MKAKDERLEDIRGLTTGIVCDSVNLNGRIYYALNKERMLDDLIYMFKVIDALMAKSAPNIDTADLTEEEIALLKDDENRK